MINDVHNLTRFKKKHPKAKIKNKRAFAIEKNPINEKNFLKEFKKKYKAVIVQMGVVDVRKVWG